MPDGSPQTSVIWCDFDGTHICLTVSVDLDVVNGAPRARFISRFRKSVESASLLD
jgi:hypothetical protein